MRIACFSDLHLEFGSPFAPPADLVPNVIVLAGDFHAPGRKVPAWGRATFGHLPIVFVSGNHELHGGVIHKVEQEIRREAEAHDVHCLQGNSVVIDGMRFLGCTLWSDLCLPIFDPRIGELRTDVEQAKLEALTRLNDFSSIRRREPVPGGWAKGSAYTPVRFRSHYMTSIHQEQRAWLLAELRKHFAGRTVVVTHHGPTAESGPDRLKDNWISGCHSSELPPEFFDLPTLWVHGHTHDTIDYQRGNCRVVCNPRGYPCSRLLSDVFENTEFEPRGLRLEVY